MDAGAKTSEHSDYKEGIAARARLTIEDIQAQSMLDAPAGASTLRDDVQEGVRVISGHRL